MDDLGLANEAILAVDRRLAAFHDRSFRVEDAALSCAGTDVPGPVLAAALRASTVDAIELLDADATLGGVLNGIGLRMFWLGWELANRQRPVRTSGEGL